MLSCLSSWLSHWAREQPGALCWLDEAQTFTFARAEQAVDEAAKRVAGCAGPQPLAVLGKNTAAALPVVLGALRARVPCFWLAAEMTPVELERVLETAGAAAVWRDGVLARRGSAERGAAGEAWKQAGAAYAFVSSGSTGEPRLALRSAVSLVAEGERYARALALSAEDRLLAAIPLAHAYAFGATLAAGLVAGCPVVLSGSSAPRAIAQRVLAADVSFLPLVRPLASALAQLDDGKPCRDHRLRVAMVGAGPLPEPLSQSFASKWGCALSRNYGSSETGAVLAALAEQPCAGAGRALPGVEAEIVALEPEAASPGPAELGAADAADTGQLWIKTATPPLGYMTREGWRRPALGAGGWWPMGDICRRAGDGSFMVLGRLGKEIRRGGRRVMPAEVVRAIEEHPSVLEASVYATPDRDGEEQVTASVRAQPGCELTRAALLEHLRDRLATYKHPTEWRFVDALPHTWSGKPRPEGSFAALPAAAVASPAPSGPRGMRRSLFAYRASEAVLAAREVGLLAALDAGGSTLELAERLRLDARALELFLPVLAELGLAVTRGANWHAADPSWRASLPALDLEAQLQGSWLSNAQIASVLRSGIEQRDFERAHATPAFSRAYRRALAGDAQRAFALRLVRQLKLARTRLRLLELGRSLGPLAEALELVSPELELDAVGLGPEPAVASDWLLQRGGVRTRSWEALILPRRSYDLVHLANAVHWLSPDRAARVWPAIGGALRATGRLLISDTFQPEAGSESGHAWDHVAWRLDWLTHGGTWLLTLSELCAQLRQHFGAEPTLHSFEGHDWVALEVRLDRSSPQEGDKP
ncbi:MAG TPA: AMP-binding protein [Polyangiaceae bacterium]|nr:AMP-binding protein [Polyangiaceae bacterium]